MQRQPTGLGDAYRAWFTACVALVLGLVPILPLFPAAYGVARSWRAVGEWHPPIGQGLLGLVWWRLARLGVVVALLFTWLTGLMIVASQIALFMR